MASGTEIRSTRPAGISGLSAAETDSRAHSNTGLTSAARTNGAVQRTFRFVVSQTRRDWSSVSTGLDPNRDSRYGDRGV